MFEIHKIEDIKEAAAYLQKEHITLPTAPQQFMGLYEAGCLTALGSLSLDAAQVCLNFIHCSADAPKLRLALAKALLNMADLHGIQTIYGKNPELFGLYTMLRFKKEENAYVLSLKDYFTATHE